MRASIPGCLQQTFSPSGRLLRRDLEALIHPTAPDVEVDAPCWGRTGFRELEDSVFTGPSLLDIRVIRRDADRRQAKSIRLHNWRRSACGESGVAYSGRRVRSSH